MSEKLLPSEGADTGKEEVCEKCDGEGYVECEWRGGADVDGVCPCDGNDMNCDCSGTCTVDCDYCDGLGFIDCSECQ